MVREARASVLETPQWGVGKKPNRRRPSAKRRRAWTSGCELALRLLEWACGVLHVRVRA